MEAGWNLSPTPRKGHPHISGHWLIIILVKLKIFLDMAVEVSAMNCI